MKVSIRKARERFSEIVTLVEIKGERVILTSHNKPKAAIVSLEDVKILEDRSTRKARQYKGLARLRELRDSIASRGICGESLGELHRSREERLGTITRGH